MKMESWDSNGTLKFTNTLSSENICLQRTVPQAAVHLFVSSENNGYKVHAGKIESNIPRTGGGQS